MCRHPRRHQRGGTGRRTPRRPLTEEATVSGALERLGRFAARRPWVVIATWAAVCLVVLTSAASFGRELDDPFEAPGLDSQRATELLTRAGAGDMGLGADVVLTPRDPSENLFDSPRARADVARVQEAVAALPHVLGTSDPAGALDAGRQSAAESGVVSPDGEVALVRDPVPRARRPVARRPGAPQGHPRRPPRRRRPCGSRPAVTCTSRSSSRRPGSARPSAWGSRS